MSKPSKKPYQPYSWSLDDDNAAAASSAAANVVTADENSHPSVQPDSWEMDQIKPAKKRVYKKSTKQKVDSEPDKSLFSDNPIDVDQTEQLVVKQAGKEKPVKAKAKRQNKDAYTLTESQLEKEPPAGSREAAGKKSVLSFKKETKVLESNHRISTFSISFDREANEANSLATVKPVNSNADHSVNHVSPLPVQIQPLWNRNNGVINKQSWSEQSKLQKKKRISAAVATLQVMLLGLTIFSGNSVWFMGLIFLWICSDKIEETFS